MPASPRPRRLHLLGSNARIYIAQECTTRGSRRLHLLVQEHNPKHVYTKKIHAPQHTRAKRRVHLPCTRPRDACTTPLARVQDMRTPFLLHAPKDGRTNRRTCKAARVTATCD